MIATLSLEKKTWLAETVGDDAIHTTRIPEGGGNDKLIREGQLYAVLPDRSRVRRFLTRYDERHVQ